MLVPLGLLAVGSILAGFPFKDIFAGHGVGEFFRKSLKFGEGNHILEDMHHVPYAIALLPTVMMALGFVVAWRFYIQRPELPVELARQQEPLYRFLLNKWYFDELYDLIFVRPTMWLGRFLWKYGDGWLIDGFGPDGVSARVLDVTRNVVRLQTGYLYHYAFAMLIGVAALITWFMFARRSGLMMSWPILSVTTFLPLVGALFIMLLRGDGAAEQPQRALGRALDHADHLRDLADPGLALRSRRRRNSSSSRSSPGSAAPSPITWASTASRCRS